MNTTPSQTTKTLEQIVEEVGAWSEATFPGDALEAMLAKLGEEARELSEAASTYLGPWSDLDGPFTPGAAAGVGKMRRLDLLDEIADCVFVLVRIAHYLGADFREVLESKWDIVRARACSRQLEPKTLSTDDRPMINRSSNDDRKDHLILWSVGVGYYLVDGDPSASGRSISHWVSNSRAATRFTREEAEERVKAGRMIDEKYGTALFSDIATIAVAREARI